MAASGAFSAKSLTVTLPGVTFQANAFTYTHGYNTIDVTNEDSGQKEELAQGLEKAIRGSASGFVNDVADPTVPSGSVAASLSDGKRTRAFQAWITNMSVTATTTGGSEVSFDFEEAPTP